MFFHVQDLEVRAKQFDVRGCAGGHRLPGREAPAGRTAEDAGQGGTGDWRARRDRVSGASGGPLMEADCDRCLEPARFPIDSDFTLYYRPVDEGTEMRRRSTRAKPR